MEIFDPENGERKKEGNDGLGRGNNSSRQTGSDGHGSKETTPRRTKDHSPANSDRSDHRKRHKEEEYNRKVRQAYKPMLPFEIQQELGKILLVMTICELMCLLWKH